MDAPKKIWAWPDRGRRESVTGRWSCNTYSSDLTEAYILAAEHDRLMAEKDAEIARLHDKLCVVKMVIETLRARQDTVRNEALEDAAKVVDEWYRNGEHATQGDEIRAMKGGGDD